jgi:tRNA G18 (ribose-2'-O)-methylase SpoU
MATLRHITSIDDAGADLAAYSNLTDAQLRARDFSGDRGVFIAEGELVVRKLIGSRFPVRSLLVTQPGLERISDALERLPEQTPVYIAPVDLVQQIVGFPFHRGVLACGERAPDPSLESVLAGARAVVILEDLANHDNVGGVFRNVGALVGEGAAVLLSPGCCDPLYRKSLRVSIGQALVVPFARITDWPGGLGAVRRAGFTVLAFSPAGSRSLEDLRAGCPKPALLLGAEGPGLTGAAMALADATVRIPMARGADSLNVSVALAVALSHLCTPS